MSPRKVRLVTNLIKGMGAPQAQAQLSFLVKKPAPLILKLLKSGVSSAVNNFNLLSENLRVYNIFVDEGRTLKRFRPRAFGRAGAIHKKTSHITLVLEEKAPGVKKAGKKIIKEIKPEIEKEMIKEKKEKIEIIAPARPAGGPKEIKPRGRFEGITKRIFRRKAIG